MHETKLTKNVLNQFSNTTNQSIENFLQSFDFINDSNIQIRGPASLQIINNKPKEILFKCEQSHPNNNKITNDIDDQIEDINLESVACNKNGFWKGTNPITTKFDNFLPDEDRTDEETEPQPILNNRNRSNSFDLDSIFANLSYTPTSSVTGAKSPLVCDYELKIKKLIDEKKQESEEIVASLISDNDNNLDLNESQIRTANTTLQNDTLSSTDDPQEEIVLEETNPASDISTFDENMRTLFPGEVHDSVESDLKFHITKLDITTKLDCLELVDKQLDANDTCCSDAVESFTLEATCDYSQNVNKPRFSFLKY